MESTSIYRYCLEQTTFAVFAWVPTLIGIILRSLIYRLLMNINGNVIIQSGVIIKRAKDITLHNGVYLDHGVYLHAMPSGIEIGAGSRIMYNTEVHVFNFRNLENSHITIGENCVIGPYNIILGQGGTTIGNNVIIAPRVSILPINHYYQDTKRPIKDQGISAKGIIIEDDVWIGHGATILDGVKIMRGSVIGAGAVVNKDVPAYSLVAGPLAEVKKNGTTWIRFFKRIETIFWLYPC